MASFLDSCFNTIEASWPSMPSIETTKASTDCRGLEMQSFVSVSVMQTLMIVLVWHFHKCQINRALYKWM
eukprot:3505132-Ditylum_brightwellii.AAC.1